jgi:hypothetical protein
MEPAGARSGAHPGVELMEIEALRDQGPVIDIHDVSRCQLSRRKTRVSSRAVVAESG